jgi:peptide/nickel transport system substrate-binding protein
LKRLLVAICAIVLCAAGCTRTLQTGTKARNSWTIPGTLRIGQREDPDNLNILLGTEVVDTDISMFWAGYLFNLNDRNELVPELATTVPTQANGGISRDGLTITYRLRRGVVWQDGAPFTASDVVFTWHEMLNPANNVVSRFGYDVVSSVTTPDPYTLVVHLKRHFSPFVATFFTMANHPDCILPKHLLAKYRDINRIPYNQKPIGTGPFIVRSYEPGSRIELVANDRYWRGRPKLDRVEFLIVGSDNTLLTLMESHQIDFFYRAPESMAQTVRNIPGTRVILTQLSRFADVGFNGSNPALADVRVRRALAYATDRKALIDKVTHGIAVEAQTDQPSFSWAFDPRATEYPYDPKRASDLLAQAGRRHFSLTLVSFTGAATVTEAEELLQSEWRDVGVDVTIKNFPSGQLYATLSAGGIEQSGKFDAVIENWANGSDPDESILVTCHMAPPAGWNIYHFCDPTLDAAERTALSSYDRAVRARAYATVQERINEELPFYVLWYERQLDIVNTDFKNYRPAHAVTPFWNTWAWSI